MGEDSLFSDYLLPAVLAVIMFGMGTSLTLQDFREVALRPKAAITGLCCQMLLLPALAFGLAALSPLAPAYQAGLVIIAACPGGAASNLVTYLLKGAVALSVSLTAVNSLLILFSIPLIVNLGLQLFMGQEADIRLPFSQTVLNVFLVTVLPVGCGIGFRKKFTRQADHLQKIFRWLLPLLLAIAFAGVLFIDDRGQSGTINWSAFFQIFPYALALNVLAMLAAYGLSSVFLRRHRQWYTIAIEVGLQNSGLALFVAGSLIENKQMAFIAVVYGSFTFFSTLLIAWLLKEKGLAAKKSKPASTKVHEQ